MVKPSFVSTRKVHVYTDENEFKHKTSTASLTSIRAQLTQSHHHYCTYIALELYASKRNIIFQLPVATKHQSLFK